MTVTIDHKLGEVTLPLEYDTLSIVDDSGDRTYRLEFTSHGDEAIATVELAGSELRAIAREFQKYEDHLDERALTAD